MEINKLALEALEIACRREANGGAKVTDILKHLAGEVIEAEEALTSMAMLRDGGEAYAEELADIIICALIAAAADNIDIGRAIVRKMKKNARRANGKGDKI